MKDYQVKIRRIVTSTALIEVRAANEDLAMIKAEETAEKMEEGPESLDWELDNTDFETAEVEEIEEDDDEN